MNTSVGSTAAAKKITLLALLVVLGFATIVSAKPDLQRVNQLLDYGYGWLGANSLPMAFYQFNEAINLDPTNEEANLVLGIIYQVHGDNRKALETWAETEKNTGSTVAAALSGDLLFEQGKLDEAEQAYQRVLKVSPNAVKALFGLGLVAEQKGKHEAAIAKLEKVVELGDGDFNYEMPQAYFHLGRLYLDEGNSEAALEKLEKATLLKSHNPDFAVALAEAYEVHGDKDKAIHEYRLVLQLLPEDYRALEGLQRLGASPEE